MAVISRHIGDIGGLDINISLYRTKMVATIRSNRHNKLSNGPVVFVYLMCCVLPHSDAFSNTSCMLYYSKYHAVYKLVTYNWCISCSDETWEVPEAPDPLLYGEVHRASQPLPQRRKLSRSFKVLPDTFLWRSRVHTPSTMYVCS